MLYSTTRESLLSPPPLGAPTVFPQKPCRPPPRPPCTGGNNGSWRFVETSRYFRAKAQIGPCPPWYCLEQGLLQLRLLSKPIQ